METQAVINCFCARVEDIQGDMDGNLRWHLGLSCQFSRKIFAGLEAAAGDQFAVEVGKADFQKRKRLCKGRAVVEDRVDDQRAGELGMAAHDQVAALDL